MPQAGHDSDEEVEDQEVEDQEEDKDEDAAEVEESLSRVFTSSGGGGGGGVPSRTLMTHLPRCTGEVLSATDVSARMPPLPNKPRR